MSFKEAKNEVHCYCCCCCCVQVYVDGFCTSNNFFGFSAQLLHNSSSIMLVRSLAGQIATRPAYNFALEVFDTLCCRNFYLVFSQNWQ